MEDTKLQLTPVLIPTEDTSESWGLYKSIDEMLDGMGILHFGPIGHYEINRYYLFLISKREIKQDNCVLLPGNEIGKVKSIDGYELKIDGKPGRWQINQCFKIEFTNDPEFTKGWLKDNDPERKSTHTDLITMRGVPEISDTILREYVNIYNKKYLNDEIGKLPAYKTGLTDEESGFDGFKFEIFCEMTNKAWNYDGLKDLITPQIKFNDDGQPIIHFK